MCCVVGFIYKQKAAYELLISDWSSVVCSSDLVVGAEVVGQVQFCRGAGRDADGGAVEFRKLAHAEALLHQKALAVVHVDTNPVELQLGVSRIGPGGGAGQHVNAAGLQRCEGILEFKRHEEDFDSVTEQRSEERREGKGGCSTCRSRWSLYQSKTKTK